MSSQPTLEKVCSFGQTYTWDKNGLRIILDVCAIDLDLPFNPTLLSPVEKEQFQSIKAPLRQYEYLRSRILLKQSISPQISYHRNNHGYIAAPEGYVLSLSHKQGHVAIASGSSSLFEAVAIDLECCAKVKSEIISRVAGGDEAQLLLRSLQSHPHSTDHPLTQYPAALIFTCKETFFKLQYPLSHTFLNFEDAHLRFRGNEGELLAFEVECVKELGLALSKRMKATIFAMPLDINGTTYVLSFASLPAAFVNSESLSLRITTQ